MKDSVIVHWYVILMITEIWKIFQTFKRILWRFNENMITFFFFFFNAKILHYNNMNWLQKLFQCCIYSNTKYAYWFKSELLFVKRYNLIPYHSCSIVKPEMIFISVNELCYICMTVIFDYRLLHRQLVNSYESLCSHSNNYNNF